MRIGVVTKRLGLVEPPPLVWVLLGGILLTRTAFFMAWPFLAIILARDYRLTPSQIGSVLGAAFLTSALVGFYSGNLSDRLGRRRVMLVGCAGAVVAYFLLAAARGVALCVLGAFLVGLSRSTIEAPGTALIVDHVEDRKTRDVVFHVRYFLINVGGAAGPLLGVTFGLSAERLSFWVTGAVYAVFGLALVRAFRRAPERVAAHPTRHASLTAALAILRRDRRFLLLLSANFLVMAAYAQQESTLIQHVSLQGGARAIDLVTTLLATNGLTIVLCQFPLLGLLRHRDLYFRTYSGLTLFALAFASYAFLPVSRLLPWVVATWVLSVGESVLFPTLQLQVDRLARRGLEGSYFGAAGLAGLGFGLGPFVGGVLLEHAGGTATFLLTAMAIGCAGVLYRRSSTAHAVPSEPDHEREPTLRARGAPERAPAE